MCSGRRLTKRQATSRGDHLWPELWRGKSINGQLKNQSSIMQDDYEEFTSLTLRPRVQGNHYECKKNIGNTNGSSHALQDMQEEQEMARSEARLMISNQNLRVSWKPVKPQECVWKNLYRIVMRTILQEKEQFTATLQFGTQIYSYASSNEDTRSKKHQWDKEWEKLEKIPEWDKNKSQKQIRGDR